MKSIINIFLSTFVVFIAKLVLGQAGNVDCNNATVINTTGTTTSNTNVYSGNSSPDSWLVDAVNGSSIENVGFYQFIAAADGAPLEFVVCIPSGCGFSGIQIYLFEQCSSNQGNVLSTLQLCNNCGGTKVSVGNTTFPADDVATHTGTNGFGNTYTVSYQLGDDSGYGSQCNAFQVTGLIPGQTYYWGVDGYSGADCPYTIQFNDGISVLSIELIDFKGFAQQEGNFVTWTTNSEFNNDYFLLESSKDGEEFQTIARVEGAGKTTNLNTYQFLDTNPLGLLTYYRLTQVDYDGNSTKSKIISVFRDLNEVVKYYPSPMSNELEVLFSAPKDGVYNFCISNSLGALQQVSFKLHKGENYLTIEQFNEYASGIYIIQIIDESGKSLNIKKVIKK